MSDPVKNAEVEDVLSSIRRLVSEDKRPLSSPKLPETEPEPVTDRLVLTADHRVLQDEAPEEVQEVSEEEADELVSEALEEDYFHRIDEIQLHPPAEAFAEAPAAEAPEPEAPEPEAPEVVQEDATTAEDGVFVLRSEPEVTAEAAEVDETHALSAKIEALETAIGKISDDWEPDGVNADDNMGTNAPAMDWEDAAEDERAEMTLHHIDTDKIEEAVVEEVVEDVASTFVTTPPEPQPEETGPSQHAETGDAPDALSAEDTGSEADDAAIASDDHLIDEEALRDMVSDIVRQELQGALGERITRNVRKLVRREIHRALTAREMD